MTIKQLFESIDTIECVSNPFENAESQRLYDIFYDMCVKPFLEKGHLTEDDANVKLAQLLDYERSHAFEIGYKTALSLIFAGIMAE